MNAESNVTMWYRVRRLHLGIAVTCLGAALTLPACSDDDDPEEGTAQDAGREAALSDVATKDVGRETATADVTSERSVPDGTSTDHAAPPEAGDASLQGGDASLQGGDASLDRTSPEATLDAAIDRAQSDSRADVAQDGATPGADAPFDSTVDAPREASAAVPLSMCGVLDSKWGIATDAAACASATPDACSARVDYWAADIGAAFGDALFGDCRINQMLPVSIDDRVDYANTVSAWTLKFFGCPNPADSLPAFALIPAGASSHVFTTADLGLLSELYLKGIDEALLAPLSVDGPLPALSNTQRDQIRAELTRLSGTVAGTVTSSTYTYNACPADAGTDGRHD